MGQVIKRLQYYHQTASRYIEDAPSSLYGEDYLSIIELKR